ncbi:MAG: cupin [Alphaproteobacteria bacterium]|nr:cupin [Alphaproteobacteria bacterium]
MSVGTATIGCDDLDAAMAAYEALGFRLDMIMPADAPRLASMSGDGVQLKLELNGVQRKSAEATVPKFTIVRAEGPWHSGRAGMLYRDLIPDRLGGRVIASHIRIPDGGPVPDYVHYHRVRFQMIFCAKGWVRVVYQDQGVPFEMKQGDCVLQPPGIRHRVLDASPGLEVIEVSAPAEHETYRDHELGLPTAVRTDQLYGGQRFVRHVAGDATWQQAAGSEVRETGIGAASDSAGDVCVLRLHDGASVNRQVDNSSVGFLMALSGRAALRTTDHGVQTLATGDACVIPPGAAVQVVANGATCELLEVVVRIA